MEKWWRMISTYNDDMVSGWSHLSQLQPPFFIRRLSSSLLQDVVHTKKKKCFQEKKKNNAHTWAYLYICHIWNEPNKKLCWDDATEETCKINVSQCTQLRMNVCVCVHFLYIWTQNFGFESTMLWEGKIFSFDKVTFPNSDEEDVLLMYFLKVFFYGAHKKMIIATSFSGFGFSSRDSWAFFKRDFFF